MNTTMRSVVCPHCKAKLQTSASSEKQIRCPKCRAPFRPTTATLGVPLTKIVCRSCQAKLSLKAPKPGAKFKCPKCGSNESVPTVAERSLAPTKGKKPTAPEVKPAVKPGPAKKPAPTPLKTAPKPEIKKLPNPANKAPALPAPSKPSTPAPSSPVRQRDDEDSGWRISGKLLAVLICLVILGASVGAWSFIGGDTGSARAAIQGDVTIDGTPVEIGSIHFSPLNAQAIAVQAAKIEGGKYTIPREHGPSIGMCKVTIRVQKKTGRQFPKFNGAPGEVVDEVVEAAAERFNVKSILTFDVKAGSNTADFEISAR